MADVKYIKMTGGEDVVAKFTENSDGTVTFLEPIRLITQPDFSIAFVPMFIFAEDPKNVTLPANSVRYVLPASADLKAEYLKKTSGLITVSPNV